MIREGAVTAGGNGLGTVGLAESLLDPDVVRIGGPVVVALVVGSTCFMSGSREERTVVIAGNGAGLLGDTVMT